MPTKTKPSKSTTRRKRTERLKKHSDPSDVQVAIEQMDDDSIAAALEAMQRSQVVRNIRTYPSLRVAPTVRGTSL